MSGVALELDRVSAGYGDVDVLHDVSFRVATGSVCLWLGGNGAGKTTLLRAVSGLVRMRGRILFEGARIDHERADRIARLGIAHVPEGRGTLHRLTVAENLRVGGLVRGRRDLDAALVHFPALAPRLSQLAGTLSGGEQQMLAIGRALMAEPTLLLLDEPSFGLAPSLVEGLFGFLERLRRDRRLTVVLVEQHAHRALDVADDVYVLDAGRLVTSGAPPTVRADRRVREAYLGG